MAFSHLIALAIYLTVGLSVFAHGLSAAPPANRYARWYQQHPRDQPPQWRAPPQHNPPRLRHVLADHHRET